MHSIETSTIPQAPRSSSMVVIPPQVSLQDWADRINASWEAATKNVLEAGRRLLAAKASYPHGAWGRLFPEHADPVSRPLRFSRQTAFRLMKIAEHPALSNVTYMQQLPPNWGTLYELSKLSEPIVLGLLKSGTIHPEMRVEEALALRAQYEPPAPHNRGLDPEIQALYSMEIDSEILGRYMWETNEAFCAPLQFSPEGKILSGTFWLPTIPGPAVRARRPARPLHRCECGHVHEDCRERGA